MSNSMLAGTRPFFVPLQPDCEIASFANVQRRPTIVGAIPSSEYVVGGHGVWIHRGDVHLIGILLSRFPCPYLLRHYFLHPVGISIRVSQAGVG